jgi:hypothetical protein
MNELGIKYTLSTDRSRLDQELRDVERRLEELRRKIEKPIVLKFQIDTQHINSIRNELEQKLSQKPIKLRIDVDDIKNQINKIGNAATGGMGGGGISVLGNTTTGLYSHGAIRLPTYAQSPGYIGGYRGLDEHYISNLRTQGLGLGLTAAGALIGSAVPGIGTAVGGAIGSGIGMAISEGASLASRASGGRSSAWLGANAPTFGRRHPLLWGATRPIAWPLRAARWGLKKLFGHVPATLDDVIVSQTAI